jgi:xanthine dehydrogenase small subunit
LIKFILNQKEVNTTLPAGMVLLDFIRYQQHLMGTKIGCREGDCGACTVLVGGIENGEMVYRSVTSCLMAIGNAHGKHVVTIEGLNMDSLNPVQQAMSDEGATQCGFCTPGFVVSLAGFCLSKKEPTYKNAIASIDGNICRCTGYKSIEKAAGKVALLLDERKGGEPILFATLTKILPGYFNHIKERLTQLSLSMNGALKPKENKARYLGGGTDLYVQQHENMVHADINFMAAKSDLKGITKLGNKCIIGASATVSDIIDCNFFNDHFPDIAKFIKLVSSTPIRNMATIAGNFINASPIGDLTVFFLALDARLILKDGNKTREVPLRNLYKGYKVLDKKANEFVEKIWFELPGENEVFNFEKVSKRTHLDIASVNAAISLKLDGDRIVSAGLSAGGVGPVPLYLKKTSTFLTNKILEEEVVEEAIQIALTEISPISDARGTDAYKTLLLAQLIKAHFITLFPALQVEKLLNT